MTPKTWAYGDVEGDDLPIRDRPYESFGQQGLAMPTYEPSPYAPEEPAYAEDWRRGAMGFDVGEPLALQGTPGRSPEDDRIREQVWALLKRDEQIDAAEVEVVVHGGEVVLSGSVAVREARARAEELASRVRGVVDIENRVRVGGRDGRGR